MRTSEALARMRGKGSKQKRKNNLAAEINREHRAFESAMADGLAHAVRAGVLLIEAKASLKHGGWMKWVQQRCEFSQSTAERYMRVAGLPNSARVPNLSFREALKLLAEPKDQSVHYSSESPEWYTPPDIIRRVEMTLKTIDLDPCADPDCSVPAGAHLTKQENGLQASSWLGSVYMNPPYGDGIGEWVQKLCEEYAKGNVREAIALVPARVDTGWFRMFKDFVVCFIDGRLKFSGCDNSAPFPSAVIYLGPDVASFRSAFEPIGTIWARIRD